MTQNLKEQLTDEEALTILNTAVLPQRLSPVQEIVLRLSWSGRTYEEIADSSGYSIQHIRDVGYQLWQFLSKILGEKVTKKNVQSVVQQILPRIENLDSQKLGQDLTSLEIECRVKTPVLNPELARQPGGSISANSPFYIERPPTEERCYEEILTPGSLLRIKAPKQMGKTSLMTRILADANRRGYATARLNLSQADRAIITDSDKFLRWLCMNVSHQLNLKPEINNYWDEDLGSKVSCTTYFQGYILRQIDRPLVLALDEVDLIFEFPAIARDFLPLLRFWYEEAGNMEIWQNLRQVVVHSTEIYIPLNLNQSPFNVGVPIKLQEFTLEQVLNLASLYRLDWLTCRETEKASQLMAMVGGHPYLIGLALYHLSQENYSLEQLLKEAATPAGIYGNHLRRCFNTIGENTELETAMKKVVNTSGSVDLESRIAYKLDSMGLVKIDDFRIVPSCELYRLYFERKLA